MVYCGRRVWALDDDDLLEAVAFREVSDALAKPVAHSTGTLIPALAEPVAHSTGTLTPALAEPVAHSVANSLRH